MASWSRRCVLAACTLAAMHTSMSAMHLALCLLQWVHPALAVQPVLWSSCKRPPKHVHATTAQVAKQGEDAGLVPEVERSQLVINLTMDLWEQWKAACAASDCRMRHRASRHPAAAAAAAASQPAAVSCT